MKTNRSCSLRLAIALVSIALSAAAQGQPVDGHKLSPSEVKTLIKSASTPEDHLKLAEFFRHEAAEEAATARFHEEMAETYEPSPLPSKSGPVL